MTVPELEPAEGDRFCALSESALAHVSGACRWPMPTIGVFQALNLAAAGITPDAVAAVFRRCLDSWNAVAGLELYMVDHPGQANIVANSGRIDGPLGVLGQSYLPCGNIAPTTQLGQLYDDSEQWGSEDMLFRVVLHELGHALGLDHAPQGSGAVMEPFLSQFTGPKPWDVQQMQARYGPPRRGTTPAPPDAGLELDIPAAGNYLVYLKTPDGTTGGGVVMRFPAPGRYPLVVASVTRR